MSSLDADVEAFAIQLMETSALVLPSGDLGFEVVSSSGDTGSYRVIIKQADPAGLILTVDGVELLRLFVHFQCSWSSTNRFLAVLQSSFEVRLAGTTEPLYRYDYLRDSGTTVPSAHLNVHANRDEIVYALLASGLRQRGKGRSKSLLRNGKIPKLSELHFPLGGHRFRPSYEDVLEMLILEFGINVREPTYREALSQGRARFRRTQLRSAVSDDPETAPNELIRLGYEISVRPDAIPPRLDRINAL